MSVILVTGGTGLVGKALTKVLLSLGYEVIVLTRDPGKSRSVQTGLRYAGWDIQKGYMDEQALVKADHIIHLAGAGVAERRWTKKRKKEIRDSRVLSGRLLINYLSETPNRVRTLVSSSAIGWYGPDPVIPNPAPFTENAPPSADFLGATCRDWEKSVDVSLPPGIRLVKLRTGIVLSREGGALKEFIRPLRLGVAAVPGSGRQVVSWIHITDLVNCYINAIENMSMRGVYNAVAPAPVSTRELVMHLAKSRGKWFIPFSVPSFILKMVLGEMSTEVLKSTTVSCDKLVRTGFHFSYPDIDAAIKNCLT